MDFQTLLTVAFSGAFLAFLQFLITFFITRKDNKEKEAKDEKKEEAKEAKDARFNQLEEKIKNGLAEREATGRKRYEEHKQAISDISKENKENFDRLLDAIESLKENDDRITGALEKIASRQDIFGEGILGLTRFELMYITDIIKERKYITVGEKATIKSMYEPYKKLGGNGLIAESVNHVMNFPVVSEAEAKRMDEEIEALKIGTVFKSE